MSGPPDHASPSSPAERRKPQVALWVFVGVVVLIVVSSLVAANAIRASAARTGPVEVVRSFLEALAAADATRALSYAAAPPADQTLLSDAVLAESMRGAPMKDIDVALAPGATGRVQASYTLGGTDYDDSYTVSKVGAAYKLDRVSASVFLTPVVDKFPVVVNGTPLTTQSADVFPVTHVVTTGLPNVAWGDDATFVGAVHAPLPAPSLQATITAKGKQEFRAGARKLLGACLAQHRLAPKDCPFGFTQPARGPKVTESTVRWKVEGNPWAKLGDPEIAFIDQGTAKADAEMTFTVTCRFSDGQGCRPQTDTERVTFAGYLAANPMKVVFTAF